MDDLAKRLSFMSFAVIGIIVLIGVYQKRGWLEMFTIGGEVECTNLLTRSVSCGRCHP